MGNRKSALESIVKILVTGNLGYVGSHLTKILVSAGHEVVGCDLSLFPNSVCGQLTKTSFQFSKDFRLLTQEDLIGIDAIAHLAGISNDPMGELDPGLTSSINGEGSVQLAHIAKKSGIKIFAFASSCSIYGSAGDRPRTEIDATNPLSEYAASKLFAESGLSKLVDKNFQVYLLRNATAYGASAVLRTDLVVNDLSAGMCANGLAEIRSDGSPWRPLIHAFDMARAFKEFIEKNPTEVSGTPINIGFNAENFQVKEIAIRVKESWPAGEIVYKDSFVSDQRNYKVSFDKLSSIFPNFAPKFPLAQGIKDLRDSLLEINYSKSEYSNGRYVRIVELKKSMKKISPGTNN
jgi:nucleoside-diphosphate-sugar epimerase